MASVALIEMLIERLANIEDQLRPLTQSPDFVKDFDFLEPSQILTRRETELKEAAYKKIATLRNGSGSVYISATKGMCMTLQRNGFKVYVCLPEPFDGLWIALVCWGREPLFDVSLCGYRPVAEVCAAVGDNS